MPLTSPGVQHTCLQLGTMGWGAPRAADQLAPSLWPHSSPDQQQKVSGNRFHPPPPAAVMAKGESCLILGVRRSGAAKPTHLKQERCLVWVAPG